MPCFTIPLARAMGGGIIRSGGKKFGKSILIAAAAATESRSRHHSRVHLRATHIYIQHKNRIALKNTNYTTDAGSRPSITAALEKEGEREKKKRSPKSVRQDN